ncbi:MAG: hypothetical protein RMX59_012795 [Nostoc sp. DedSLP05]
MKRSPLAGYAYAFTLCPFDDILRRSLYLEFLQKSCKDYCRVSREHTKNLLLNFLIN